MVLPQENTQRWAQLMRLARKETKVSQRPSRSWVSKISSQKYCSSLACWVSGGMGLSGYTRSKQAWAGSSLARGKHAFCALACSCFLGVRLVLHTPRDTPRNPIELDQEFIDLAPSLYLVASDLGGVRELAHTRSKDLAHAKEEGSADSTWCSPKRHRGKSLYHYPCALKFVDFTCTEWTGFQCACRGMKGGANSSSLRPFECFFHFLSRVLPVLDAKGWNRCFSQSSNCWGLLLEGPLLHEYPLP